MTKRVILITLITFLLSTVIYLIGAISHFENRAFDLFSRLINPEKPSNDRIVIITVDQHSIDELNRQGIQWPWPRQIYAPIIEFTSKASAVFMDILFTESSSYGKEDDEIFAKAIELSKNVYMPLFLTNQHRTLSNEDLTFIERFSWDKKTTGLHYYESAILPIDEIRNGIKGLGNVTILPDDDGVYRVIPLVFAFKERIIPQFVISYFSEQLSIKDNTLYLNKKPISSVKDRLIVKYYKDPRPFKEISATDILKAYSEVSSKQSPSISQDFFENKFVFIGLTAAGLYDLKPTAVSAVSTGIVIHSTVFDNILNNSFIKPIELYIVVILMFVLCLLTTYISSRYHSILINLFYFLTMFLLISSFVAILFKFNYYHPITAPILSLALSFIVSISYSYATEGKQRLFIKRTFSRYMDEKLVNYLLKNPDLIEPGGQERYMTVFFADIAGFTSMAEKLGAEKIAIMLRDVLNAFTEIIIKNYGVIDKYIGDCVMAFWGAPEKTDKDEYYACLSAINCLQALEKINEDFLKNGFQKISVRIGINSGNAITGNLGSDRISDYTVIGDTVNLASRLEGVNKFFGTNIIVSESTITKTKEVFHIRELGLIEVKGKNKPVKIYELLGLKSTEIDKDKLKSYETGLSLLHNGKISEALKIFKELRENYPEEILFKIYEERCNKFLTIKNSLTESDLMFKMDSK
ncbi:MAG TPA: adenylate/guanylate cyclase domain-containing protein [Nitrospirae bacterium]|nr:adenylate/guanylate cyclase domain-containing protein [Nitrospirota bacterium]